MPSQNTPEEMYQILIINMYHAKVLMMEFNVSTFRTKVHLSYIQQFQNGNIVDHIKNKKRINLPTTLIYQKMI